MLSRTIAFLLGIIALQQFPALPTWHGLVALAPPLLLYLLLPRWRVVSGPLAALAFGLFWAAAYGHWQLKDRLAPELEGVDLLVVGEIRALPHYDDNRVRFELLVHQAYLDGEAVPLRAALRLNWYGDYPHTLSPGQQWQLMVRLKRPWGMRNPGGFDYESWLFQQGLGATGYVRNTSQNRLLGDAWQQRPLQRLRHELHQRLQQALAESPARGIIIALAIGERGAIEDGQWTVLLSTGTNHLVAISGLHVGLVAGMVFWLWRRLWQRCPRCCLSLAAPRAAAVAGMLAGLGYAALAGFAIPTQRALIMLSVVFVAVFLQRPLAGGRALMVALWLVLLWQPTAVLAAGFWLSFAAVALILYGMQGRLSVSGLWWRWGRVQWVVSFGLLPLLLLFFGQGSLSSPLANLVAVPWVSLVVVPLTLIGTALLLLFEPLGGGLVWLAAALFQWLWPLLAWLGEGIPMLQRPFAGREVVLAGLGLLWMLLPRGWPLRPLGLLLCLPLIFYRPPAPGYGEAWFTLLDVGQGLAAIVQTREHLLVYDTGPGFPSGFNTGDAVLLPWLRRQGQSRVDKLVISHSDMDHLGGARALAAGSELGRVFSGEARRMDWIDFTPCQRGQQWVWDGVRFKFLHPDRPLAEREGNNDSCVLRVEANGEVLLLTGDIDNRVEQGLVAADLPLESDVLVAPHHGSASSSSPVFVASVSPQWVLFSAGYRNRHAHPREKVVARYTTQGAKEYQTWRDGAIRMELGKGMLLPEAYRWQRLRYWHGRE